MTCNCSNIICKNFATTTLAPWLCPPHHAAFAAAIARAPGAAAAPCRARWRSTAARRGRAPRASPAAGRRARAPGARAPRWRCRLRGRRAPPPAHGGWAGRSAGKA
eukprot:scaffold51442_cov75-Phaeocystis_antarctica.AAC.2